MELLGRPAPDWSLAETPVEPQDVQVYADRDRPRPGFCLECAVVVRFRATKALVRIRRVKFVSSVLKS